MKTIEEKFEEHKSKRRMVAIIDGCDWDAFQSGFQSRDSEIKALEANLEISKVGLEYCYKFGNHPTHSKASLALKQIGEME